MVQPPSYRLRRYITLLDCCCLKSTAISTAEPAMNACRSYTPPKLGLHSLRDHRPGCPPTPATPPHRGAPVSVPFLWEEVPGKPREPLRQPPSAAGAAAGTARSLGLPPRLVAAKARSSPTTVLEGPELYGSFREVRTTTRKKKREGLAWFWKRNEQARSDSSSSSSSVASSSSPSFSSCRFNYVFEGGGEDEEFGNNTVRITRLRRKGSLANIRTSHILGSIYGSIKQAMAPLPWRRERKNLNQ